MRTYRVVVKRGLLYYKVELYIKIWFFWWFLEGIKTKSQEASIREFQNYIDAFEISTENQIIKHKYL